MNAGVGGEVENPVMISLLTSASECCDCTKLHCTLKGVEHWLLFITDAMPYSVSVRSWIGPNKCCKKQMPQTHRWLVQGGETNIDT